MAEILVDTDVFVDHLRGARMLPRAVRGLCCSVVTRAELFAGNRGLDQVRALLEPLRQIPVDTEIAEQAGRIRRETGIGLADALIAATALTHSMALATRNRRDFARVPGLVLQVPDAGTA